MEPLQQIGGQHHEGAEPHIGRAAGVGLRPGPFSQPGPSGHPSPPSQPGPACPARPARHTEGAAVGGDSDEVGGDSDEITDWSAGAGRGATELNREPEILRCQLKRYSSEQDMFAPTPDSDNK